MTEEALATPEDQPTNLLDPRALLATWANENDEWVRFMASEVIASAGPLTEPQLDSAYALFRQEKGLDERELPEVEPLSTQATIDETAPPLTITKLSEVHGVNALSSGAKIEPHEALTVLFGENGTGKTGYARIFKALARSRTDDEILGNVEAETVEPQTAKVGYQEGLEAEEFVWTGQHGVSPFTRMSIFDTPSVSYHIDDSLEYVYVPAALALFNYVSEAISSVQARIDAQLTELRAGTTALLGKFPRTSSVYAEIETLGASTDLGALKVKADWDQDVDDRLGVLRRAVAALEANALPAQINLKTREIRVLQQAKALIEGLLHFDAEKYNGLLTQNAALEQDFRTFRDELFTAASLPADPDDTWSSFISAGETYRQHLIAEGVHDADRCLYCRQELSDPARTLLTKYQTYLEDKIQADIATVNQALLTVMTEVRSLVRADLTSFLEEQAERDDRPPFCQPLSVAEAQRAALMSTVTDGAPWAGDLSVCLAEPQATLLAALDETAATVSELEKQAADQATALKEKRAELAELEAAAELARSWSVIETRVANAKEADRLTTLKSGFSSLLRRLTELSKTASDELMNQNFGTLFAEECELLRAPALKVQFLGRGGKPQRRKVLSADHRVSLVLSEGEQKVLAMADFLAEARLAGTTAPVLFDDPVSSLDHRRLKEVAERVVALAETNQVIVFTHDIFFTTTMLALSEKSKRCTYFQVTDEGGKGKVTKGTHPAWDTLKHIRAEINTTIEDAKKQGGETRAALVRSGYSRIRAWCEVFVETELLQGVSGRYQPNIRMGSLTNLKFEKLAEIAAAVNAVFEDACRFTEAHSQPLPTQGTAPTVERLEEDWAKLKACKKLHDES